ncbi:hypothetical protein BH23ACT2_BH23ACT2_30150 [soil metagenome]
MTATRTGSGVDDAATEGTRAPRQGLRWQSPGSWWPLWVLTVGMPLLYLTGFHGLAWSLPGIVFGIQVVAMRMWFPPRAGLLLLFCGWALLSATLLPPTEYPLFAYRWLIFAGTLTALIWVINHPERLLSTARLVSWLAALWITMIAFGYLALVFPAFDARSPFQTLTGPLGRIQFIVDISGWRFAEFQTGQDVSLPRPAAPFAFANSWGAGLGVLTPFFIRSWLVDVATQRRRIGIALLVAAVPPVMASGNRGVWISISAASAYWVVRRAAQRDLRPLALLVGVIAVVAVFFFATPAGELVSDRLATSERSTDGRASIYDQTWQGSLESPLLGHGKPEAIPGTTLPPMGTHGLVWYLMYVHGFVGLALFGTWLISEVVASGRSIRTQGAWWVHLSLVIALVQVLYYGMQPQIVLVGVAAGIAYRERARVAERAEPRSTVGAGEIGAVGPSP